MQDELKLSPQDWGLVTSAFLIAYALFEVRADISETDSALARC